jgi:hypothetical protein
MSWAFGLRMLACTLALSLSVVACGKGGPDANGDGGNDGGNDSIIGNDVSPDLAPVGDIMTTADVAPPGDTPVGPPQDLTMASTPPPYVRGSLKPVFELAQLGQQLSDDRNGGFGTRVDASDLQAAAGVNAFLSVSQKLSDVESQINGELQDGATAMQLTNPTPVSIFRSGTQDANTAQRMIFRGKPTSIALAFQNPGVAAADVGNPIQAYVTLGGDISVPGNEVAVVDLNNLNVAPRLITVGVAPQKVVRHPSNLIFVINRYSNYISVIDPNNANISRADDGLSDNNTTPNCSQSGTCKNGIVAEYFMSDLAFEVTGNNNDRTTMWATNRWRNSLYKYTVNVLRNPQDNTIIDSLQVTKVAEYGEICNNPKDIALDGVQGGRATSIYISCGQGGMVVKFDPNANTISRTRIAGAGTNLPGTGGAFAGDLEAAGGRIFVNTAAVQRGQFNFGDVNGIPTEIQGIGPATDPTSGQVVHPGALFDNSFRSRFEDQSNDIAVIERTLVQNQSLRITDSKSAEANIQQTQRQIDGTVPRGMFQLVLNGQIHLFVAYQGNNVVQEFLVNQNNDLQAIQKQQTFNLGGGNQLQGPLGVYDVTADLQGSCLFTADQQSDTMTIVNRQGCQFTGGQAQVQIDLGYAYLGNQQQEFPATKVEAGELFFWFTGWSNNKQKSCGVGCHIDEAWTDGSVWPVGTVPQGGARLNRVQQNMWGTGSFFTAGNFADLATNRTLSGFDQIRQARDVNPGDFTGIVELGFICGLARNVQQRVAAAGIDGSQGGCNDLQTQNNVPNANAVDNYVIQALAPRFTVANKNEAIDIVDLFAFHQARLFPNPGGQLFTRGIHPDQAKITAGQTLFGQSGANCAQCHSPQTNFLDGKNHGQQADWNDNFINKYNNDNRLSTFNNTNGQLPDNFLRTTQVFGGTPPVGVSAGGSAAAPGANLNYFQPKLEAFSFFFEKSGREAQSLADLVNDVNQPGLIQFFRPNGDILSGTPNIGDEPNQFNVIRDFGLNFKDRFSLPGNPFNVYKFNTPSLRGMWDRQNFLHDGRAWSIQEVILRPGHPALNPNGAPGRFGEMNLGYAVDNGGTTDVHGMTSALSVDDIQNLLAYVNTIE